MPAPDEVVVSIVAVDLESEPDAGDLTAGERARASAFVRAADRRRYVTARAGLRRVLGAALGVPPAALELGQTPYARPCLIRPRAPQLDFNVSHSGARALIALASGRRVGVDIEATDARRLDVNAVTRSLSPTEQRVLARLAPSQRRSAFFGIWVRKEACLKARGGGLSLPLDDFDVAVAPGPGLRRRVAGDWEIADLDAGEGYAAAVAVGVAGAAPWRLILTEIRA